MDPRTTLDAFDGYLAERGCSGALVGIGGVALLGVAQRCHGL